MLYDTGVKYYIRFQSLKNGSAQQFRIKLCIVLFFRMINGAEGFKAQLTKMAVY